MNQKNNEKILIYSLPDGENKVDVLFSEEDFWMTQGALSELYQTSPQNITMHIKNIYDEKELMETATCKFDLQVRIEGNREVKRKVKFYNLEMIIAIGFRTKSSSGNIFRKWANSTLKEYMVKGFVMDDKRLKDSDNFGHDYFDELLLRIRSIRASEKRFYQKVMEIYSTSIDYNKDIDETALFFKTVQNKLHYAISGETAAEIIYNRVDNQKDNMGLTSWNGTSVQKKDIVIAKNYLNKEEIQGLEKIVTMYLDYAEEMAKDEVPMYMADWRIVLDEFLKFNRKDVLTGSGKISHIIAKQKALKEYELYDAKRISNTNFVLPEKLK